MFNTKRLKTRSRACANTARGFTLIELIVVLVIIGIIAVLAAPDYLRFKQKVDLEQSSDLLQTGFYEAYSLARSRSEHFIVQTHVDYDPATGAENNFFLVRQCTDLDCSVLTTVADSNLASDRRELQGSSELSGSAFRVMFLAPHGDMVFLNPADLTDFTPLSDDELALQINNGGLIQPLTLYRHSGLITTDTP